MNTFRKAIPVIDYRPKGTVTFLIADIEESIHLQQQIGEQYADALVQCRQLMRAALQVWDGHEIDTRENAFSGAFARATDAVSAAVDIQRAVAASVWPRGLSVRVRMGLHTGEPLLGPEGYVGLDLVRGVRLMRAGSGGQVLLSQTTHDLVEHHLPDDVSVQDLGAHRLKDLQHPVRLFQLMLADLPSDFPPLKTLDLHPHNLPIQSTALIRREKQVDRVAHLLSREDIRLVTLTGPGGVGKTRLGLQVLAELADRFPDGAYFVNLAPISDAEFVVPTIAQVLSIKAIAGPALLDQLKAWLREKQLLILLDNFEQVIDAAEQVAALLAACANLKILVTSRIILHIQAEHEFAVPPLALPDPRHLPDLGSLSQYEAVALFLQRAQAVKPDFQVTTASAPAIAEICIRLDGLPLAIELAAARIKMLPPPVLLARLGQRLDLLTGGARDLPVRQQTLRNTIAWSYQLLDAAEQQLFQRISVFAGGCTLKAVETISAVFGDPAGQVFEGVASLIDKSMLQQTEEQGEEPHLLMLETIQEYGQACLKASGEEVATRHAHAAYYLALAEAAEQEIEGPQQALWLERLEREHDNLRAALSWWLAQEQTGQSREKALRLCAALEQFWMTRGNASEGRVFLERALAEREGVASAVQAKALATAAWLAINQGDMNRGEALCQESLSRWQALGDVIGCALSLQRLAVVAWVRNNPTLARSLMQDAIARWKEVGDKRKVAWALTWLAYMASQHGEYARALALCEESLTLFRELECKIGLAGSLGRLTEVLYLSQSDPDRVHALCEEALALSRETGDKLGIAHGLRFSGLLALNQGDTHKARSLIEEALALFREIENREGIALAFALLARVEASQGDHAAAHTLYRKSLTMASQGMSNKGVLAFCLEGLASLVAAEGELVQAARFWGAAEALRESIGASLPTVERADYEQKVDSARTQLGGQAFAAAWAEGRTLSPEQVLATQGQTALPTPEQPSSSSTAKSPAPAPHGLTAREIEVLRVVAQGLTNEQVAQRLVISPRTVDTHLTSIYGKIGVSSRAAATRYAVEHHLV